MEAAVLDMQDKTREARLRRQARRLGLDIEKSRVRNLHLNNRGLWQIRDGSNCVRWGAEWELLISQEYT
jgi:hypothetical protein